MTNHRRLEWCRRLWPVRPGSAPRMPEQEYKTAKQFGFWFSWLYLVERAGEIPASINNRNPGTDWTRKNYASSPGLMLLRYCDPEIFRSYELSTRWATSR